MANAKLTMNMESTIFSIRTASIPTRSFPVRQTDASCRICGLADETISHLLTSCPVLSNVEYLTRHNAVCKVLYSNIAETYEFEDFESHFWNLERPPSLVRPNKKLLWDQRLLTPSPIEATRPDLYLEDSKRGLVIEVAVTGDSNVCAKEEQKSLKYQALIRQLQIQQPTKTFRVIPVVIGVTGVITSNLKKNLSAAGINPNIILRLQESASQYSAHLLRKIMKW
jgi:hypothetical protein